MARWHMYEHIGTWKWEAGTLLARWHVNHTGTQARWHVNHVSTQARMARDLTNSIQLYLDSFHWSKKVHLEVKCYKMVFLKIPQTSQAWNFIKKRL